MDPSDGTTQGQKGRKVAKSSRLYSWSRSRRSLLAARYFGSWKTQGRDALYFVSLDVYTVYTDNGPVPYVRLEEPTSTSIGLCEDMGGLVGLGTKEEIPGVHFIMTPGDTMSADFDYS